MKEERVLYQSGETTCKGFLVIPDEAKNRPGILVVHAFRGQDDFARAKTRELAELGYIAFAVDIYGEGKAVKDSEEASALMKPFFQDRTLLQERILAAYNTFKKDVRVDASKIGAIGFCFGGLTVLELLRTGEHIKGVVSFHGVLGDHSSTYGTAKTGMRAKKIDGSILILHGYEDPLSPAEDIAKVQKELTDAGADWQTHMFGNTAHAFMVPFAKDKKNGLIYNERTAKRAWQDMMNFFEEIFEVNV